MPKAAATCIVGLFILLAPASIASTLALIPGRAPVGARVVVVGVIGNNPMVEFKTAHGRVSAAVVEASDSVITVIVPETATSGSVRISESGTVVELPFTLTAPPPIVKSATLAASSKSHDLLKQPSGLAVLLNGTAFVGDRGHDRIRAILANGSAGLTVSQFREPEGIAFDRARNILYVADSGNHVIRVVTMGGAVSTFAGSGRGEDRDGTGALAGFKQPTGLAIDAAGDLYVADTGNDKIRKVTSAGVVTTLAGAGRPGLANGSALQALFKQPRGVAVAEDGTVYVADSGNHVIRRIDTAVVSTFAGTGHPGDLNGTANNAEFKEPVGVALDDSGQMFVADSGNHQIRSVAMGQVTTVAGSGKPGFVDGGSLSGVAYKQPSGIAAEGAIFIADTMNDAIRVLYRSVVLTDLYPRRGDPNGGESIRIFGAGFVPGQTQVTFGGTIVEATYVSSTELRAQSPAGAIGTTDIVVTTPGGSARLERTFEYFPPFTALNIAPLNVTIDPGQTRQFNAAGVTAGGSSSDLTSRVTWTSSSPSTATIDAGGMVNALAIGSTTITATYGSLSVTATLTVRDPNPPEPIPPDPSTVAPLFEPGTSPPFVDSIAFLYSGVNAIQPGVLPGTIDELRASVIRGRVLDRAGNPLSGVRVTIADHPELGHTVSRLDGRFDLAVNGGGPLIVRFERSAYISVERQVRTPWRDHVSTPDVVLIALDGNATTVLGNAAAPQIARGSEVTDSDGTRRATMIFAAGTTATAVLPDGSTQPLPSMTVRATEYTVGPNGPQAMPAALPPQSGYTYCVELSVDEARAANAKSVQFSKPVAFYVENFLGFNAGLRVPQAYYDRERHAWIPARNGHVVRIVRIESGAARVDTDGDGVVDDAGLDVAERQQLAVLYPAGATLWRVVVSHFTPLDLNWSVSLKLPQDAVTPTGKPTNFSPRSCPSTTAGSIIECENQTLGEVIPVTGSGFALHYGSDRTRGRIASRTMDVHVSGASVPASLRRMDVEISIAGQVTLRSFSPVPNLTFRYIWDGRDAYGRLLPTGAPVSVRTTYVYDGEYEFATPGDATFGLASGIRTGVDSREPVVTTQVWQGTLGSWTADALRLGGWTLTPHHFYDVTTRTLFRGDGSRKTDVPQQMSAPNGVLETIAGRKGVFDPKWLEAGGPARGAALDEVNGAAVAPDGTIYLAAFNFIQKITPFGQLVHVAGKSSLSQPPVSRLPQPAATTAIWSARAASVGPDGSVYIAEQRLNVVRRITPDGMIAVFAGTGGGSPGPNGIRAVDSSLAFPTDVAAAPDGSVYIAEADAVRVRRVGPDGMIYTVAGTGALVSSGDGGPATDAGFREIANIALGPDGSLYIGDRHRIRRVGPDGLVTTVAGNGIRGVTGDGGSATAATVDMSLTDSSFLTVTADGSIYFAGESTIRRIDPAGIINTVLGTGVEEFAPDGTRATASSIEEMTALTSGPDGKLWFQERFTGLLRTISPTLPAFRGNGEELAIGDGGVVHIFTSSGRHLRTLHADTGAELIRFGYQGGLLMSMVDHDGNTTTIERGAGNQAVAVIAAGGQRTTLATASFLESVTTAPGETTRFEYTPEGLMESMLDPRGKRTTFAWNALGLLERDEDPEGGAKNLSRTETGDGHRVTITTELGRATAYTSEERSNADSARRMVDASNLQSTSLQSVKGVTTSTSSDGMTTTAVESADPAWGMQTPFTKSSTVTWPSGRTLTMSAEREAVFAVEDDPLTLVTRTDRMTVNGRTTLRIFDRNALTDTVTTPGGLTLRRSVDEAGRITRIETPGVLPADLTYDVRGRLARVAQGTRAQTFGYNARNELTSIEDALARTVRFEYDGAGRVTRQILPDLREIGFTYDAAGNLTSVVPAGRPAHTFRYNGVNLSTAYVPPALADGSGTEYIFNVDRELEEIVRPDGTSIDFDYDGGGRLRAITAPDASRSYTYGSGGNLSAISGEAVSLAYLYDGATPTSMTWSGTVSGRVAWTYDGDARLASESVSDAAVSFTYDDDSMLKTAGALRLVRGSDGLLDYTQLGSSTETFLLDGYGNLDTLLHQDVHPATGTPRTLLTVDYTRDNGGRITGIIENANGTELALGYHFDASGRLDTVTHPDGEVRYGYDSNGNRISREMVSASSTTVETASYDAQDRLLNYEGTQYTYTPNGDLLTKTDTTGTTHYVYDALGNLLGVTLPAGTPIGYLIDGQSRRVGRTVSGVITHRWLYSDQLRIIAELDAAGAVTKRFVYGTRTNVPDYMIASGVTYRIYSDHLGSPRTVVNLATGVVVQGLRYDEFGYVLSDTNPGFIPFGFAGGLYDVATGLVRFGARDYDARVGRWTGKEPLGFAGGDTNFYAYVLNDPVNLIDPSGLDAITDDPHGLAIMASLFRRAGSGFTKTERTALILQDPSSQKYLCYSLPWSAQQNKDTIPVIRHPWAVALIHTHPQGRTQRADGGDDPGAARTYGLPIYVLSRGSVHKFDPAAGALNQRGEPKGAETTELVNTDYYKQNNSNWFNLTDSDSCGCR